MKITVDGMEMYSTAKEGQVIQFTSDSVNYSLRSYRPNINLRARNFTGTMLNSLVSYVPGWTGFPLRPFILHFGGPEFLAQLFSYIQNVPYTLSELPVLRIACEKKRKVMWSSLPVLILWMVKDKLDIFDNWRLAAVCRDWRSASARYPRTLHSVGDGVPWLLRADFDSSSMEVFSFLRKSKSVIEDPEFAKTVVIASKEGWLLLHKRKNIGSYANSHMFLMNLFTRAQIKLPDILSSSVCNGTFTVSDGIPERVFLCRSANGTTDIVETACPGDDVWTSYTFSWPKRKQDPSNLISIGQKVYFHDGSSKVTVFDIANQSCKKLPPLGSSGFIAEHCGELIYIERRRRHGESEDDGIDYDYSSYAVYKHNDAAPNSWEKFEVTDMSWFLCSYNCCIAAKGKGLKVYDLRQVRAPGKRYFSGRYIAVYDLNAGTTQVSPIPFEIEKYGSLKWIAIG